MEQIAVIITKDACIVCVYEEQITSEQVRQSCLNEQRLLLC